VTETSPAIYSIKSYHYLNWHAFFLFVLPEASMLFPC